MSKLRADRIVLAAALGFLATSLVIAGTSMVRRHAEVRDCTEAGGRWIPAVRGCETIREGADQAPV